MTERIATALRYQDATLTILDQRALPAEKRWVEVESAEHLVALIQSLAIRGAPLIGVAAVLYLAVLAKAGSDPQTLAAVSAALRASRPTAVNLMNLLDRLNPLLDKDAATIEAAAIALFDEDVALCERIGQHGLALFTANSRVLTHCNTGGLPTAGRGTALGVITKAQEQGLNPFVWVDETRPLGQGSRLTAFELKEAGVAHKLQPDSAAASLLASGQVDLVIVGADRIAANGDTANKVGTLMLAVVAKHYGVPFYIAAPWTTVDSACAGASAIPIEQRPSEELLRLGGKQLAPEGTATYNPGFDVTPAALISGWITDRGLITDPRLLLTKSRDRNHDQRTLVCPSLAVAGRLRQQRCTAPNLADRYQAALADAAVIEPGEAVPLPSPGKGMIKVVTWSKYPNSFPQGRYITNSWGDTWVTLDGAVKRLCRTYQDKVPQTQALLGLHQVPGEVRDFVILEVNAKNLFRPCADPDTSKQRCSADFPKGVSAAYKGWYANQVAASYQANGFPWTRLGYTYNYNIGASEVGPAEFVLPKGSHAKVIAVIPTGNYCQ